MSLDPRSERVAPVIGHDDVGATCEGQTAVQDRHDVGVPRQAPHRNLLGAESLKIDVVLIGTEHLDGDDAVKSGLTTAVDDTKTAAPCRRSIIEAFRLEFGN